MKANYYRDELTRLLQMVESKKGQQTESILTVPASEYTDPVRLKSERRLFAQVPLIVGHVSQIARPGDYFVHEDLGISYLIVRGDDGVARAFLNHCQHRGTKLVHEPSGRNAKRFSCPYHAWCYSTHGELIAVPREDLFPGLDKSQKHLRAVPLEEKFGLLWLTQKSARPLDEFLAGFATEFSDRKLDELSVYFNQTRSLEANWKLPLDAFLESYHIAVLHKASIGPFFVRHVANSSSFGPHIRSLVPRSNIGDLRGLDWKEAEMREFVTVAYILFPNACFIFHPTSTSILTLYPGDEPGRASWNHLLLVEKLPETEAEISHYEKTIRVLDGMTFVGEDFWVSEQIQLGLNTGAIDELTLGATEGLIHSFHESLSAACRDYEV